MIPIQLMFHSKGSITVYAPDPDSFVNSILLAQPPDIANVECDRTSGRADSELQEVRLLLESGASILCHMAKTDVAKADLIDEITECSSTNVLAYAALAKKEADLDERFVAASKVIKNVPDLDTRQYLFTEYLKRKQAYVSAIEALVDGVMRRPSDD